MIRSSAAQSARLAARDAIRAIREEGRTENGPGK
jgi:hypothetical protein